MMVTAEFSAFPARYVISSAEIDTLQNAPNMIWDLPAGIEGQQNTQVGTLEAANLNNYSGQIEALAQSISSITRTPRHYFEHQGAQISGEALITMEAPLVKKVYQKRELFGDVWQEVGQFALLVMGHQIRKNDAERYKDNADDIDTCILCGIRKNNIGCAKASQQRGQENFRGSEKHDSGRQREKESVSHDKIGTLLIFAAQVQTDIGRRSYADQQ